jgi:short-subunit dehydrogenase
MPKTILITGATTGIGRHLALHFAARGDVVIATGRKPALLDALRAEAKGTLHTVPLDVTDDASITRARDLVAERTDGIDVLVNNAGYGQTGPLEELSDAELRAQFDTNVFGLMAVTRAFLPSMRARGGGRIINVSSVGGRVAVPLFGAYTASKYAVEALSDALRVELAPAGIDVVLVEPGPIRSEFGDRAVAALETHRRSDSPYAAAYARVDAVKQLSDRQSVGPEHVARVMARAIDARRPHARYVVPFRSRVVLWLAAITPTPLLDAIMRALSGLRRRRLAGGAPRPALPASAS